ncbi:hypothetical protein EJL54_23420 [Salmonella enterica]|nr:hypothetical protein [Salmonella enterica]
MFGAPAPPRQRPGWVQIARAGDVLARCRYSAGLTAAAVMLAGGTAAQMPPDVRRSRATAPASGMGADREGG